MSRNRAGRGADAGADGGTDGGAAIAELCRLVGSARAMVAFTGAGISTECGIPDFRGPGGFWTRNRPIEFGEYLSCPEARKLAWQRKFAMDQTFAAARPGRGHRALAGLVAAGRMTHIITQNIDNLHQASGVAAERIVELHGNTTYAVCLACGVRHEIAWVRERFAATGAPPGCAECGGIVKTATISFGQAMPQEAMARAEAATRACDLMLSIGSSLQVYPAAGFPVLARERGAGLVIINREPTPLDGLANLVIDRDIGHVLALVAAQFQISV